VFGRRESRCAETAQSFDVDVLLQETVDSTYTCDGTQYIDVTFSAPVKSW